MPNVKAYRPHRRLIPQPDPDAVGIFLREQGKINFSVDVAPIVEDRSAQPFLQRNRKAQLRIEDQEHVAADGHRNRRAGGWIALVPAGYDGPLWSCAVNRKAAQGIAAAGKEFFAQRHPARLDFLSEAEP